MKFFDWLIDHTELAIVGTLVFSYFVTWWVTGCPSPHNCVISH